MQAPELIKQYVQRIERLNEERDAITEDRKEVYAAASSDGLDKKALRNVIKLRKKDREKLKEEQEMTEIYLDALEA